VIVSEYAREPVTLCVVSGDHLTRSLMRAKANTFGLPMLPAFASLVAVATAMKESAAPPS